MITRKFIEKVHDAFDELNYRETKKLNFDNFEKQATNTLTHSENLADAIDVVRMYQFCLKHWDKIEKLFDKKLDIFNEYDYEGNSLISLISDEQALGTYYITNGINKKVKEVFIASHSFDEEEMFAIGFNNGKFTVFDDGDYYLKYSKMSASKMKLFDNKNNCLCNIVLSEDCGVFLENNCTPYYLALYDDFIGIYERSYTDTLLDTDILDTEKLVADIEWDILEKNSELGVSKLNIYSANADLEMLLLFASSTFLVFQKYMKAQKNTNIALMSFWVSKRR